MPQVDTPAPDTLAAPTLTLSRPQVPELHILVSNAYVPRPDHKLSKASRWQVQPEANLDCGTVLQG
jgi:hypothetical protein